MTDWNIRRTVFSLQPRGFWARHRQSANAVCHAVFWTVGSDEGLLD